MKVVINVCYGRFDLSEAAVLRYAELKGMTLYTHKEASWLTLYLKVPHEEYKRTEEYCKSIKQYEEANKLVFSPDNIERADPILIQVVEELGAAANGSHAQLKVVEIPDDVQWEIAEYDGWENVAEVHRTWS